MILLAGIGLERSQDELAKILGTDETGDDRAGYRRISSCHADLIVLRRKNDAALSDIERSA